MRDAAPLACPARPLHLQHSIPDPTPQTLNPKPQIPRQSVHEHTGEEDSGGGLADLRVSGHRRSPGSRRISVSVSPAQCSPVLTWTNSDMGSPTSPKGYQRGGSPDGSLRRWKGQGEESQKSGSSKWCVSFCAHSIERFHDNAVSSRFTALRGGSPSRRHHTPSVMSAAILTPPLAVRAPWGGQRRRTL